MKSAQLSNPYAGNKWERSNLWYYVNSHFLIKEGRKRIQSDTCAWVPVGIRQKTSCFQVPECSFLKPNAQQTASPRETLADSSLTRALHFHLLLWALREK